jgi:erythromycin esterase-like protein
MCYGGAKAWNLRDTHMFETLTHILDAHGADSKAIVWAHNSHIGDARFTEMGRLREELNLGQLARQKFGEQATLIGFGTHTGTVAAASHWEGPVQLMRVRPSVADSYERLCHESQVPRFLLDLGGKASQAVRLVLIPPKLERFIGVVYRPDTELMSHYAEASLPQQFDAYVWLDETTAVTPLSPGHHCQGVADAYPFGR